MTSVYQALVGEEPGPPRKARARLSSSSGAVGSSVGGRGRPPSWTVGRRPSRGSGSGRHDLGRVGTLPFSASGRGCDGRRPDGRGGQTGAVRGDREVGCGASPARSSAADMKAVVQEAFGGPDVLRLADVPDPVPDDEHAVVRLRAAALNWHDVLVRRGRYGSPLPHVPGADGAGIDIETGAEVVVVPSLHWGEDDAAPGPQWEILGDHRFGTYAELVRVPRDCVAPKPEGFSWEQAAALPVVGLTTYRALFTRGRLQAGERLLVLGAGGGVATTAVSMAGAGGGPGVGTSLSRAPVGARVYVTSSSDAKIAAARELGAAGGVRYDDSAWPEAARELAGGFDLVL